MIFLRLACLYSTLLPSPSYVIIQLVSLVHSLQFLTVHDFISLVQMWLYWPVLSSFIIHSAFFIWSVLYSYTPLWYISFHATVACMSCFAFLHRVRVYTEHIHTGTYNSWFNSEVLWDLDLLSANLKLWTIYGAISSQMTSMLEDFHPALRALHWRFVESHEVFEDEGQYH